MLTLSSNDIRQLFLEYFSKKNHTILPSASLVPHNDPSLLFVNAGMVPFKDVFLGAETREYTSAASVQRCLRVGGKHNDLDQVGFTPRHHTLFEMLGNFSFGAYFKKEAIEFAWDFLTVTLQIPTDRLWISVHLSDDETYHLWHEHMHVPKDRISRCGDADNFWSMGDIGPCGPCTEIFYDLGDHLPGSPPGYEDQDGPRYMEIWNIVFMQFERNAGGEKNALVTPCVDTGMGLERIAAVLQGVSDTYATDQFQAMIHSIRAHCTTTLPTHVEKILADHSRSSIYLIHDGISPGPEGRSYVLRRLIRRALRYAYQASLPVPCLSLWTDALIDCIAQSNPALMADKNRIRDVIYHEELQFSRTLKSGLALLQDSIHDIPKGSTVSGALVFKLYDTYGFPVDLTETILTERELHFDHTSFDEQRILQKKLSQANARFHGTSSASPLNHPDSLFVGHEQESISANIIGIYTLVDKQLQAVDNTTDTTEAYVVLDTTPFYPESGGQVGDKGDISGENLNLRVLDTQIHGSIIVHHVQTLQGRIQLHKAVECRVDPHRFATSQHHSATHLLHAALRSMFGPSIMQKGSLVESHRLRFDFSCTENLHPEQLQAINAWVNNRIQEDHPMVLRTLHREEALAGGAIGLFEDQYQDMVRVIAFGDVSQELCGGTHVTHTGAIGAFYITQYSSISATVRRIEAIVGNAITARLTAVDTWKNTLMNLLQCDAENIPLTISTLQKKIKTLETECNTLKLSHYMATIDTIMAKTPTDMPIILTINEPQALILQLMDYAKNLTPAWIICLGTPLSDTTPIQCVQKTSDAASTQALVHKLERLAHIKGGIKPGSIRGVIAKALHIDDVYQHFLHT